MFGQDCGAIGDAGADMVIVLEMPAKMGWEAYYRSGVEDDEDAIVMRQREVNAVFEARPESR